MKTIYFILAFLVFGVLGAKGEACNIQKVEIINPDCTTGTASIRITMMGCGNQDFTYYLISQNNTFDYSTSSSIHAFALLPPDTYTVEVRSTALGLIATTSKTISDFAVTIPSAVITNPTCGNSGGSIFLDNTDYSYQWNAPSAQTNNPTGLTAGIYQVTITDTGLEECTATNSYTLTDMAGTLEIPEVGITPVSFSGAVDGAIAVPTNLCIQFSNSSNACASNQLTPLAAGTYTVRIADNSNGCSADTSITVPEPRILSFSQNPVCNGDSITLIGEHLIKDNDYYVLFPNALPVSYMPTSGSNNLIVPVPSAAISGNVEVCLDSACSMPIEFPNPYLSITNDVALQIVGYNSQYCSSDGIIDLAGLPLGGVWSAETDGGSLTIDSNGGFDLSQASLFNNSNTQETVKVQYAFNTGCTDPAVEEITFDVIKAPEILPFPETTININDDPINLHSQFGTNTDGNYSGSGGVVDNYFHPGIFQPGDTATVTYTEENSLSCSSSESFHIYIVAIVGLETSYCSGDAQDTICSQNIPGVTFGLTIEPDTAGIITTSTSVSCSSGGGFFFNPPTIDTQTTYTVTATYSDSSGIIEQFEQIVTVSPQPAPTIMGDSTFCYGEQVSLTGNYLLGIWKVDDDTVSSPNIPLDTGSHSVIYSVTENGCTNTDQKQINILSNPIPTFSINDTECLVPDLVIALDTSNSTGIYEITNPDGQITPDAKSLIPTIPGTYILKYSTTSGDCTGSVSDAIEILPLPEPQITSPGDSYCLTPGLEIPLEDNTNTGGTSTFTVTDSGGVQTTGTSFIPNMAGIYNVAHEYTDNTTGCTNTIEKEFIIHDLPIPEILSRDSVQCTNDDTYLLNGTPAPGVFNLIGPNITYEDIVAFEKDAFPPSETYLLEYSFVDENNCTDTVDLEFAFHSPPTVDFVLAGSCVDTLLEFTSLSSGGTDTIIDHIWSYPGVSSSSPVFVDSLASSESIEMTLTVITNIGCSDSKTKTVNIGANPQFDYNLGVTYLQDSAYFKPTPLADGYGITQPSFDYLSSIYYDFGDGTKDTLIVDVTQVSPGAFQITHTYPAPGIYETSIEFETVFGCTERVEKLAYVVPQIDLFPYCADFNGGNNQDEWFAFTRNPYRDILWQQAVPTGITSDGEAWATYKDSTTLGFSREDDGWVYGPSFDLTQMERPYLSLDIYYEHDEKFDGFVIEVSPYGYDWEPLGKPDEGLNWYDKVDGLIAAPGDQVQDTDLGITAYGWSGSSGGTWKNARYKLDKYGNREHLRFRIAYKSKTLSSPSGIGAAFDNFCIKERKQNVLMEHFTNLDYPGAAMVDEEMYEKCLEYNYDTYTYNPLDVNFAQFHMDYIGSDEINQNNQADLDARAQGYSLSQPLVMEIDGLEYYNGNSTEWTQHTIDSIILRDPTMEIEIVTANITGGVLNVETIVRPLSPIGNYPIDLHLLVLEDNVDISSGNRTLRNVVRKMLPDNGGTTLAGPWTIGDNYTVTEAWNVPSYVDQSKLFVIAFVQERKDDDALVYQSTTNKIIAEPSPPTAVSTIPDNQSLSLHPNPTSDLVQVTLALPHSHNIQWELFDAVGKKVATGEEGRGVQSFNIRTKDFTNGIYFLVLYSEDNPIIIQEKLIIIH